MNAVRRPHPRVEHHVEELRKAGLDTVLFHEALTGIRNDTLLSDEHRDALCRLVASESYLWYLEALQGKAIDRVELMAEVARMSFEQVAEAKKQSAPRDGQPKSAPPNAPTVADRPAPKASPRAASPRAAGRAGPRGKPKPRRPGAARPSGDRKPKPRKKD